MLKQFYQVREAAGVSIRIMPGEETEISACLVTADGKKLDFVKKIIGLTDIRLLREHLPDKAIVALNLSGKGVLLKQVSYAEEVSSANFSQILPNASYDDFYVQRFVSGERFYVSLIRKQEADACIQRLTNLGFTVAMLSLGPYPVEHILTQLNVYGEEIVFDGHAITRNDDKEWVSYSYNQGNRAPFPIKVASEPLAEELLLAYGAVFQLLLQDKLEPVRANAEITNTGLSKLIATRKLKAEGALVLAIFFAALLLNFALLSWLSGSNAKLMNQVGVSDQGVADMRRLSDEVAVKEKLLAQIGWEDGMDKSVLVDQIAGLLPDGVTLDRVDINPFDKRASELRKMQAFADREIDINGSSAQVIPVNEWIARIKTKPWAKNVQLVSYLVNSEKNTGEFTVKIIY